MSLVDYLLLCGILVLAGLAIWAMRRNAGGCSGCSGCDFADQCSRRKKQHKNRHSS